MAPHRSKSQAADAVRSTVEKNDAAEEFTEQQIRAMDDLRSAIVKEMEAPGATNDIDVSGEQYATAFGIPKDEENEKLVWRPKVYKIVDTKDPKFDRHFRVPGGDVPSSDEDEPMPGSGAHSRKRSRDEVPGAEVPNAKKQKK